ncbi:N-acetylmuramoyl-L-alanine amidase [Sphingomonas sp. S1-29]|uniref:N-acetylmuramoyl-L-alanine amidase n=1 Tax=Sphingomonas sp. S1-29 TaxID=2991074 RepID=UPI0022407BF6|nr:N-acetylmuramoyl-L-alanine amidase [Sphingomonas sp. S1-29]
MKVLGWTAAYRGRHSYRVSLFVALLACWLGGMPAWAGDVRDIEVRRDRIVITFDGAVANASTFVLDTPRRIALDLADTRAGAPATPNGPVSAVRQGRLGDDGARIVFDLTRPAIVTEGRFDDSGRKLTLELTTVSDDRFAREAVAGRKNFGFSRRPERPDVHKVSMRVPAARKAPPLPRVYGDDDSRPLVVIDAGHGGHDPGALSPETGLREKDLTLKTALAIKDRLLESGRVRVALTRESDKFLILQERYGIARRLGAHLFISVHCDSAGNPLATGATAYTLSEVASDKEAARLAARENRADILAGIDLGDTSGDISSLLIDLAQRETMNRSANFARLLGREAQPLIPVKPVFHRMASLMVLKAPDMPSVLFETGYLSNKGDADFINSREGREKIAESVKRATEIFFARRMAAR